LILPANTAERNFEKIECLLLSGGIVRGLSKIALLLGMDRRSVQRAYQKNPQFRRFVMKDAIGYDDEPHFYRYLQNGKVLAWIDAFYGDEDDLAEKGYLIMGQVAQEPSVWQQALPALEAEVVKHDCSAVMFWADARDPVVDYLLKSGYQAKSGQGYQLWQQKL